MRQQVNLYLPEFHGKSDWLDSRNMALVMGSFLLLLMLWGGVEYWQVLRLESQVEDRRQALNEAVSSTEQLIAGYGEQSEDPQLADQVLALEQSLQSRKVLLSFLEGRDLGNTAGLSPYLVDLARYHIEGLRLTRIELREGGAQVRLNGEVTRGEKVPLFLQNLSMGQSYSGKNFQTLKMGSPGILGNRSSLLSFEVTTAAGRGRQ